MKSRLFKVTQEMTSTWILSASPTIAADFIKLTRSLGDKRLLPFLLFDIGASAAQFAKGVAREIVDTLPDDALVIVARNIGHNPSRVSRGDLFVRFIKGLDPKSQVDAKLFAMAASRISSDEAAVALSHLYDREIEELHRDWGLHRFFAPSKRLNNLLDRSAAGFW